MKAISLLLISTFFISCASSKKDQNIDPIQGKLESKNDEFRQCFLESDSYQGRHFEEKREIKVGFIIDPKGNVKDEKIFSSEFKDPNFHVCILGMVKKIKFSPPKTAKEYQVVAPINYFPAKN